MDETSPRHDELSITTRTIELASIFAAMGLLLAQALRFASASRLLEWWTPLAVAGGMIAADFTFGLVHWFADTWGSETMPLLGRRLLRPFRVHHVNPGNFLRRNFIDTNGDVAMVVIPFLLPGLFLPLDSTPARATFVFLAAMGLAALPTNQVHQWAHMPDPPRWVKHLQDLRLILSRREHARHHAAPYATHYCIALGWCNGALAKIDFFRRAERFVTKLTGLQPRADDTAFAAQIQALRASAAAVQEMPEDARAH